MLAPLANPSPLFALIGAWDWVVILAAALMIFGARQLPELARGLRKGISEFLKELENVSHGVGRSLGGIYGKSAAQALTPNNQTAELYNPAVFHKKKPTGQPTWRKRLGHWRRSRTLRRAYWGLQHCWAILRLRRRVILMTAIAGALTGSAVYLASPKMFQSTAVLKVDGLNEDLWYQTPNQAPMNAPNAPMTP
jgi:TatA/E family protein of Tat protein translocase